MKKIYSIIFLLMFVTSVANAANRYSVASNTWNNTATWSATSGGAGGASIPVAGDNVFIEGGRTVTISSNVACANLTIGTATAGTLTIGDNASNRSVTISGNITIGSSGIFQSAGNGGNTLLIGGNLTNAGTFNMNDGTAASADADVTFNGAANQTISGAGATTDFNLVTINNTGATGSNIVDFTSTNFTQLVDFLTLTDGTFKLSTGVTLDLSGANLSLTAPDGFIVNHASAVVNIGNNDIVVGGGDFQLLAGTVTLGTGNDLLSVTNGTATFSGGTLNVFGRFQMTGGTTTINGASINIDPQAASSTSNGNHIFEVTGTGNIVFTSGSVTIIDPHATSGAGNAIQIVNGGTKTFTGSTIYLGDGISTTAGADGFDINAGTTPILGNIVINNPSGTNRFVALVTNDYESSGGLTITAGELRSNGNDIVIGGDWTNNGTFTPGTDLVTFNGSAAQSISGTSVTTFNRLTINNTSGGVSLGQDVNVSGTMTFTSGVVTSTVANTLVINDAATVSGASNSSYVDGPIQKLGNDDFTFPIGDPLGSYHQLRLVNTAGANGDGYTAEYFRASAAVLGTVTSPLIEISNCEYWTLSRDLGTSTPNLFVSWTAQSPCNAFPYTTSLTGLTVARLNAGVWQLANGTNQAATGSVGVGGAGTVADNGISLFGTFALGNTQPQQNPLPVNLSNIRAFEKLQGIQIDWTAYQEQNMSHYSVERSADGITFTSIGQVASQNSAIEKNYGFFDASPFAGVNFYRLRTNDLDGKFGYSAIVKVNLDKSVKDISLYPNPATGGFISFQGSSLAKGNYTVRVYNSAGMQIMGQNFMHTGGAINQTLQLPNGIKSGMYSLQLVSDGVKLISKTFIVQ